MSSLKPVSVETLSPIIYRDQPVITSALLAQMYETEEVNIRKNFFSNQERFVPGKHCFSIEGEELRELKRYVTQSNAVEIPKQARHLTLWTARGAARHAKMLNTDKAWDVFELLEENYFAPRIVHPAAPVALPYSTVDDRRPLKQAVDAWVTLMQANGKVFTHGAAWKLVNTHFSIKRISELPAEWVKDAVAYVMDEINGVQKALPAAEIDHDRAMIQQAAQQHLKTYRPLLREVENTVLDIGGQLQRLCESMIRASHEIDRSNITIDISLAQKSRDLVCDRIDSIRKELDELKTTAMLGYAGIANALELRILRKDLREIVSQTKGKIQMPEPLYKLF